MFLHQKPDLRLTEQSFYREPEPEQNPAGMGEVFSTTVQGMLRSETYFSETWNRQDAYEDHNKLVKKLTGQELHNPALSTYSAMSFGRGGSGTDASEVGQFYKEWSQYQSDGGGLGLDAFREQFREKLYRQKLEGIAAKNPNLRDNVA